MGTIRDKNVWKCTQAFAGATLPTLQGALAGVQFIIVALDAEQNFKLQATYAKHGHKFDILESY